jgi:hypothetical protein
LKPSIPVKASKADVVFSHQKAPLFVFFDLKAALLSFFSQSANTRPKTAPLIFQYKKRSIHDFFFCQAQARNLMRFAPAPSPAHIVYFKDSKFSMPIATPSAILLGTPRHAASRQFFDAF